MDKYHRAALISDQGRNMDKYHRAALRSDQDRNMNKYQYHSAALGQRDALPRPLADLTRSGSGSWS